MALASERQGLNRPELRTEPIRSSSLRRCRSVLRWLVLSLLVLLPGLALAQSPDLQVTSLSNPPATGNVGTGFSVTDTTANTGTGSAAASTTRYRLSLDTAITSTDPLLTGTRSVASLASGATSSGTVTVTIATSVAAGTYYLGACADNTSVVAESNETNNCRVSTTTIQVTKPDLTVTSISNPPTTANTGTSFSVTDTTTNSGTGSAAASTTRYRLSLDTAITSTDPLLTGSRSIPSLAAGASSSGTVTVTIPTTVAAGTYYLGACADNTSVVAEINETNNCRASTTTVQVTKPDLTVTSISNPPATAEVGTSFSVTDTTANIGTGSAAASTTGYRLSLDTTITSSDRLLTGTRSVPSLAAGASSSGTVTVTIPTNIALGTYYLGACADYNGPVAEINETNNCRASTTTIVITRPDLVVSALSNPPATAIGGSSFSVTETTTNTGAVSAAASLTSYRLSLDTTITSSDPTLTGTRPVPSLASGASSSWTVGVIIPANLTPGTYYLGACADDAARVAEVNETNNCRVSTTTVVVSLVPSISSLNPTWGPVGTSVTISGSNFGDTQGTSTVTFNGIAATPTSWNATSIVVPVPAGATTGPVVITVSGIATSEVSFTVVQPGDLVQLIVGLNVPWQPEGNLSQQERLAQRQAIAAAQDELLAELAGTQHVVRRRFDFVRGLSLDVGVDALAVLEQSPRVLNITENRPDELLLTGSVPLVEADQAWATGFDGTGSVVAILDTGVDKNHPFLAGSVLVEACFSSNSNCPDGTTEMYGVDPVTGKGAGIPCTYAVDGCKHGTHVAGIVAGQGSGFSGVAKGAGLIAIQVFSRFDGPGNCPPPGEDPCAKTLIDDQIAGLQYARLLLDTVEIASVNMSLGGGRFTDQAACDTANVLRKEAIDNLRSLGIATVIASGNRGWTDSLHAPACISSAVSVGSTTKTDTISSFSNSASFLSLVAPGGDGIPGSTGQICSSVPTGTGTSCSGAADFDFMSGTSMAAPHVAAAWTILKQKRPSASVSEILAALQITSQPIRDTRSANTREQFYQCRIRIKEALDSLGKKFVDLPAAAPGTAEAIFSMNKCGQMVGSVSDSSVIVRGLLVSGTTREVFSVPGGVLTSGHGVNDLGEITGIYNNGSNPIDSTGAVFGFVRDADGNFTILDAGWDYTEASGINNVGEVVGSHAWNTPSPTVQGQALVRPLGGSYQFFEVPGAFGTWATANNDAGQQTGDFIIVSPDRCIPAEAPTRCTESFLRSSTGGITTFSVQGSQHTHARGLNDSGQISGFYIIPNQNYLGFIRSSTGTFTTVAYPNAGRTDLYGITDSGQAVGSASDGVDRYFIFNSLLP